MARSVSEWIGTTPDTKIPDRVMVRVFLRYDGRCQCGCNRKIISGEKWNPDHFIALINGGENRESNLRPYLVEHHKIKTREDVAEKSRTARKVKKHIGIKKNRSITRWRKMNGDPVYASRER